MEATAKFCLGCGHDLSVIGPITSTGHDLRQLKELIRSRDDISMSEKFDLIAKVEDGANPISLGLAVASEEEAEILSAAAAVTHSGSITARDIISSAISIGGLTRNAAATAASVAVSQDTTAWAYVIEGRIDMGDRFYLKSMELGMDASHHVHDISAGGIEHLSSEELHSIPVLKPPKKSFCPKCGSDIHSHTMLQWRKWRDHSGEVVQLQVQAAMEASGTQISAHHLETLDELESQIVVMQKMVDSADPEKVKEEMIDSLRGELTEELTPQIEETLRERIEEEVRAEMVSARGISSRAGGISRGGGFGQPFRPKKKTPEKKPEPEPEPKPEPKSEPKAEPEAKEEAEVVAEVEPAEPEVEEPATAPEPKEQPTKTSAKTMFGATKTSKSFDGAAADKPQWFLDEALDTVYDPHGTGKTLKPRTILARSAEGNVRVQDIIRIYGEHGEDGLADLAWTSPVTQYLIEAYDAC